MPISKNQRKLVNCLMFKFMKDIHKDPNWNVMVGGHKLKGYITDMKIYYSGEDGNEQEQDYQPPIY